MKRRSHKTSMHTTLLLLAACFLSLLVLVKLPAPTLATLTVCPIVTASSAPAVPRGSILLVNVTMTIIADEDSGNKNYWALDNFTQSIAVWREPNGTYLNDTYFIVGLDQGTWQTFAGVGSPQRGLGEAFDGSGSMSGGFIATVNKGVTFAPTKALSGFLGSFNLGGTKSNILSNVAPNGTVSSSSLRFWTAFYFNSTVNAFDNIWNWGWQYDYIGQERWCNTLQTTSGDINTIPTSTSLAVVTVTSSKVLTSLRTITLSNGTVTVQVTSSQIITEPNGTTTIPITVTSTSATGITGTTSTTTYITSVASSVYTGFTTGVSTAFLSTFTVGWYGTATSSSYFTTVPWYGTSTQTFYNAYTTETDTYTYTTSSLVPVGVTVTPTVTGEPVTENQTQLNTVFQPTTVTSTSTFVSYTPNATSVFTVPSTETVSVGPLDFPEPIAVALVLFIAFTVFFPIWLMVLRRRMSSAFGGVKSMVRSAMGRFYGGRHEVRKERRRKERKQEEKAEKRRQRRKPSSEESETEDATSSSVEGTKKLLDDLSR